MPNVDKAINNINGLIYDIEQIPKKAELFAANEAKIIILIRIFKEGKASDGTDIGQYDNKKKQTFLTRKATFTKKQQKAKQYLEFLSTNTKGNISGITYKQLRQLKGLRIDKVDLQFTGKLFESIEVVELNDKFVLGITDKGRADIAGYLEKKYGKDIFVIKGAEKEELMRKVTEYVTKLFSESTAKWSQK